MSTIDLEYRGDGRVTAAEKQIRCVAYLLESCSEGGMAALDGRVATALGLLLENTADVIAARRRPHIVAAG